VDPKLTVEKNILLDDPPAIKLGEFVFRETAFGVVKRLRFIVDHLELERERLSLRADETRVLDMGCGTGTYVTIPLAQMGYSVLGVDADQASVDRARQNAAIAGVAATEFVCGSLDKAPRVPFHAVICSELLEHLSSPVEFIAALHPFLTDFGLLILTVPNGYGYFELESAVARLWPKLPHYADRLERWLIRAFGSAALKTRHYVEYGGLDSDRDRRRNELEQSSLAADQRHYQKFTPEKILRVISDGGFEVTSFGNNTFLAGNVLNALLRSGDKILSLNGRVATALPAALASDWLIAARKRVDAYANPAQVAVMTETSRPLSDPLEHDPERWLQLLRRKWNEVPAGSMRRLKSDELLHLPDAELDLIHDRATVESTERDGFTIRGWYHCLYKDVLRGKRVLDVGCGLGIDGIAFAKAGAQVTFVDIVEANLHLVQALCRIKGISDAAFFYLESFDSLTALPRDFDVIWCQGSLINAPFEIIRHEAQALLQHLKPGGRWIELAYPKSRWEREGKMPFAEWGKITDGGAPWMEWYDMSKVMAILAPVEFDVVLHFNFHNDDFNWFDLRRRV
jgi:2-polyprenyl-3-methyl-5-hydroxy-6-metoxy-1,4-benzoquinol methylase